MKSKLKIPAAAMPVVRILRRDVPRPKRLPTMRIDEVLRFKSHCCPMGLHPRATNEEPCFKNHFPCRSDHAIQEFGFWWDAQTDAKAATDAVWPAKRKGE